ncbi:hypothetical protein MJM83_29865, partial [Salmonella enterica subsp. enterica serovar Montevideo]|nr:hypothetical protein [Salmonella enterica subsp. enterica serovar Montevideo]
DLGIEDNDWIEVFNSNGALTARAVVSQRVPAGMTMMYHAQERWRWYNVSSGRKQRNTLTLIDGISLLEFPDCH